MTFTNVLDETLGSAIGCIPSGLFVVTTRQDGKCATMLASWVQQAAFTPPALTFAVAKGRYIESFVSPGSSLVVNVLEKGQGKLIGYFSKSFEPGVDPFAEIPTGTAPSGQPYLEEAIAYLDITVTNSIDAGDHTIILATITAGSRLREGEPATQTRKNGFKY
jgi:3-hydroxy-9,10-secoandrosta-1,3,5(10)-triene-9,17-dione monooxygenase reductase component